MFKYNVMKSSSMFIQMSLMVIFMILYGCDKIEIIVAPRPYLSEHLREEKPRGPVPLGCIRGCSLIDFYGESVFITDITDDILTGTFNGTLRSSTGATMPVSKGEFRIKIFRKYMPCGKDDVK